MKNLKRLLIACICFIIILPSSMTYAHSGRTDSSGGHRDNKNASGLGYYHYHCGGNPPHLHSNGTCPYSPAAAVQTTKKVSKYYRTATVKRVQKKLNNKGCKCGKADGIYGKDTKVSKENEDSCKWKDQQHSSKKIRNQCVISFEYLF